MGSQDKGGSLALTAFLSARCPEESRSTLRAAAVPIYIEPQFMKLGAVNM